MPAVEFAAASPTTPMLSPNDEPVLSLPNIAVAFPKSDAEPSPPTRLVSVPTDVIFA